MTLNIRSMHLFVLAYSFLLTSSITITQNAPPTTIPKIDTQTIQTRKWIQQYAHKSGFPHIIKTLYKTLPKPLFHNKLKPTETTHTIHRIISILNHHKINRRPFQMNFHPDSPHILTQKFKKQQKKLKKLWTKKKPFIMHTTKNPKDLTHLNILYTTTIIQYIIKIHYTQRTHPLKPTHKNTHIKYKHKTRIITQIQTLLKNIKTDLRTT